MCDKDSSIMNYLTNNFDTTYDMSIDETGSFYCTMERKFDEICMVRKRII